MSLLERMKKASVVKEADIYAESKLIKNSKSVYPTDIPMINLALSGKISGGLSSGLTVFAAPSGHFKSMFALKCASHFLASDPEAMLLFYDSEFGMPEHYFDTFGINRSQVFHIPIMNVEELKFDMAKKLEDLTQKDKVMILVDSVGNLASKKETADAADAKSVADMTRAKEIKSVFRIATPHLTKKDIPMIVINHTYEEMGLFPKTIVSGGSGIRYSSNLIWTIGKRQRKTGKDVTGYDFVVNIDKSRFTRDKVKIPISVSFDSGIEKYSGLLDIAMAIGMVVKPSNGWYSKVDPDTGEIEDKRYREKDTHSEEFWGSYLNNDKFVKKLESLFSMSSTFDILEEDEKQEEYEEIDSA